MATVQQVKDRLLGQLERVLAELLPNGAKDGSEYRVGSVTGEAGRSLAVQLRGANRGCWQDFAFPGDPSQRGDVLSLWCAVRGKTFRECFPEMVRFCGLQKVEPAVRRPKPPRPAIDGIEKLSKPCHDYLSNRGLSDETLRKYRIRSMRRMSEWNTEHVMFPFIDSEGDPVMVKTLGLNRKADGAKDIWSTVPYYTLWGWWTVGDNARSLVITEGEIDCMSLSQFAPGYSVVSLPAGVSNMDWVENDWDTLSRFETIYLVFDNDPPHPKSGLQPGEAAAAECARRLGAARVLRVPIPGGFKDVNEVLLSGNEALVEWESAWLAKAYAFDPPTIAGVAEYRPDAHARLERRTAAEAENNFIWPKIPFQFRRGEITVISGYPGGGKSAWLYQTHVHEMLHGHRVFFLSFEISPDAMLLEMAHCLLGQEPNADEFNRAMDFLSGKLYFYRTQTRRLTVADLLPDLDYAVTRFGCDRLCIDSLHFLASKEDYEGQDNVALQLTNFAKSRDIHLALVCHSVVKKGEDVIPGMGMVEGSAGIVKPIDNGISIWRNVKKAEDLLKAEDEKDVNKLERAKQMNDAVMMLWKHRESGRLPRVKLWFSSAGKSFRLALQDEVYAPLANPKDKQSEELF
ncbi:toprim domain-containing protein [Thiocapsa sp. N5-Cardenillas]|uniref:toprim domain-containing protein n=1 Tax=Thiocapsa sp. N5-Cardenillas TaxID=3137397 RepID=UPI0035AE21EE